MPALERDWREKALQHRLLMTRVERETQGFAPSPTSRVCLEMTSFWVADCSAEPIEKWFNSIEPEEASFQQEQKARRG